MNSALVEEWVKLIWQRRPGAALCKHSILVLDSNRRHLTDYVKTKLSEDATDLAIAINKPFKEALQ